MDNVGSLKKGKKSVSNALASPMLVYNDPNQLRLIS